MNKSTSELDFGVSRKAVINFINENKKIGNDIHSFVIVKDGKVKARIAPAPYSFECKQQLFSLSKSFTSTAIGLLYDDGKIDIDSKVTDIFRDKCPEDTGKNLQKMTIRHLLSMNTGHEMCVLTDIKDAPDPISAFLRIEPKYAPGTHFIYNNAATYMLSEIIGKYTGMTLFDFLSFRLFKPLGIENVHWHTFPDGQSQGATGLHASCDDISKFGMLYLNRGIYNGQRILSEEWVDLASQSHSDNSGNGTPDWTSGYGFQFWLNSRGGYRADGALGQLCLIIPEENAVIAVEAYVKDMQKEVDLAFDMLYSLEEKDSVSIEEFYEIIDSCNEPPEYTERQFINTDKLYMCFENTSEITHVVFTEDREKISVHFSNGKKWQVMDFGKGKFCYNNINIKCFKPTIFICEHSLKEDCFFAAFAEAKDGKIALKVNFLDSPYTSEYILEITDDSFSLKSDYGAEYFGKAVNRIK